MASTNKTSNLELSQFIATDTPTWLVDYNGDMEKIDTGVGRVEELAQTASTQATGVASGLQTTNQNVTTLSGQVANVQNQANSTTASVNGINQRLGNTDISGVGDGTVTGAINALNAGGSGIKFEAKSFTIPISQEDFPQQISLGTLASAFPNASAGTLVGLITRNCIDPVIPYQSRNGNVYAYSTNPVKLRDITGEVVALYI